MDLIVCLHKGQASQAAAVGGKLLDEDDGDWNLKGKVGLNDVKGFRAKRCLHDFQVCCRAKRHKVPETAAGAFKLGNELLDREDFAGAGLSTELVFVKGALAAT